MLINVACVVSVCIKMFVIYWFLLFLMSVVLELHLHVQQYSRSKPLNFTLALSTLIRFQKKTELLCSVFKKISVQTYRFRIVFARPY